MTTNLTHNVPTGKIGDFGCSSFAVADEAGNSLFGRNYDLYSGKALVVKTAPKDGYASIGIVLDKCANIDEALELLESFDMVSPKSYTYHFFLTDKSGRSIVVEWCDGELYVVEDIAATNIMLCTVEGDTTDKRYNTLHETLDANEVLTAEGAMSPLCIIWIISVWMCVLMSILRLFTVSVDILDSDYWCGLVISKPES